jgi:HNH endonuclease
MTSHDMSAATSLSDSDLLVTVKTLVARERTATAQLIAALAEVDARRLYLGQGCSSLFTYCTQVLHFSEHEAYGRIEAARAVRRFPAILTLLADGLVHLTGVGLLAPHLTVENHESVLSAATHKTKREIEEIVAALRPQPAVPSSVRKLPASKPATLKQDALTRTPLIEPRRLSDSVEASDVTHDTSPLPAAKVPSRHPEVKPLAPESYKVQFTVCRETFEKLRHAQELLRHVVTDGDIAILFDRALTLLIADAERAKVAATAHPRQKTLATSGTRAIPAAVRREVWRRDGGQCAFRGGHSRCTERAFLEFHHVVPYADGGANTATNIELRCRAHNRYEADRWFGPAEPDCVREARSQFGDYVHCEDMPRTRDFVRSVARKNDSVWTEFRLIETRQPA